MSAVLSLQHQPQSQQLLVGSLMIVEDGPPDVFLQISLPRSQNGSCDSEGPPKKALLDIG